MKNTRLNQTLILSSLLLAGCGTQKTTAASELKIIGGSPADAQLYPAVALVRPDSEGIDYVFCSGVLISDQMVLTAAHCSWDANDQVYAAEKVGVMVGDSTPEKHLDKRLRVNGITVHPSFDRSKMAKERDGSIRLNQVNDIAVWELATPATGAQIAEVLAAKDLDSVFVDETLVTIMGFGQRSAWESPWTPHEFTVAETIYRTTYSQRVTNVVINGGGIPVKRSELSNLPGRNQTEFYAGAAKYPDTCKGDSGGPVFAKTPQGKLLLIGITSRGSGTCEVGGVYTLVPAFLPWIESVAGKVTLGEYTAGSR